MGLVIDTSALVAIERASEDWEERLRPWADEPIAVPTVVYGELLVGVALAGAAARPLVHALAEELIGHDPREARGLHELLLRKTFKSGPPSGVGNAIRIASGPLSSS